MLPELENHRLTRNLRLAAALGLLAMGAVMALKLGLMLWHGGVTVWIIYAGKGLYAGHPYRYFFCGLADFLGGYSLLMLPRYRGRDWGRLAGKVALLAISIGLTLVLAEVAIRTYLVTRLQANSMERLKQMYRAGKKPEVHTTHPMSIIIRPTDDPRLVYDLQPNLNMDFGHKLLRTNRDGMRADHDYPRARRPHSVRLVGLGDSGMFGWSVEQGEEYMAVLERLLNQRGDGVVYEALNFAVPGYNTQLEAETLRLKALPFQPDVVVVGWCENDFGLPFFMLEVQNFRRRDISFLQRFLFSRQTFLDELQPVAFKEQRDFNVTNVMAEIKSGTDTGGVRQALEQMKALSQQHDFHLLVFGPMGRDILQLCRETGVAYYSTYEKIAADKYPAEYAVHFMHPRPEGHRVLAEHLAQELDARGWLKPRTLPRGVAPATAP
ncbi:MAG: SGNH/GDSL hydrolase family protein [Kiritimatiellaeota bacterium]|nr:SGNH/GDSL hydrolase family protein [Kiritimatiellota bacterium]